MIYIQGDTITSFISNVQYFDIRYFQKFIEPFTTAKNALDIHTTREFVSYQNKPLIFITKVEYLDIFYRRIIPLLKTKFILITHYGDRESGLHIGILHHPLLIKWYGQNMSIQSPKTVPIPIGLENKYWGRTKIDLIKKNSSNKKENLVYLNFSLNTHPVRSIIMDRLLQKGFKKNVNLPWDQYIEELSKYKFCISPRGNGIDCHRIWECLYLGVIPIVIKTIHLEIFSDLPILFIHSYDCISIEYLNQEYESFKQKNFNLEKLDLMYWKKEINELFKSN